MGRKTKLNISSVLDCSPIEEADYAKYFSEFSQKFSEENVFALSKNERHRLKLSDTPFAYVNYKDDKRYEDNTRRIWTGRWVGRATFIPGEGKKAVTLEVTPRFGNFSIFAMIEEAFSCNIVKSKGKQQASTENNSLMDLLIPFIWSHKLSQANQYGVPHNNVEHIYKGPAIKGRLDVRKSIIPLFREHQVVSIKREKQVDEPIAQIITQAYKKVSGKIKVRLSPNAENALNAFYSMRYPQRYVSENEYRKIHYKPIYYSFKDIVDFSWQIIKARKQAETEGNNESFSGFLDMAEIWEIYLRSILRKNFSEFGWVVESPAIKVYDDAFWSREIIPDIVMTKGNDVVIFDAKWKKMEGKRAKVEYSDLDRSDFFQIHSYISYYKAIGKRVVLAGLLYPLEDKEDNEEDDKDFLKFLKQIKEKGVVASNLWGEDDNTQFVVSGILLKKQPEKIDEKNDDEYKKQYDQYKKDMKNNETAFVNHIKILLGEVEET